MENRVLRYFVEMANEKSMSKAAEKLHVTQPTMSRQLKELEKDLGTKLFNRTNYAIRLTDAGELFLRRAIDILTLVDKTKNEFLTPENASEYEVNIGCPESDSIKHVAKAIRHLKKSGINIICHIHSGHAPDVLERLNKGLDDFSLILDDVDSQRYNNIPLQSHDKWVAIMKKGHPLSAKKSLATDDLIAEPLIISRQAAEQVFPVWFGENAHKLNIAASFNLAFNGSLFVKEGLGIMISLDKLITTNDSTDLIAIPISGVSTSHMKLVWKKSHIHSMPAKLLIDAIIKEFNTVK